MEIYEEFKYFGQFIGSFFHTFRIALGDNDILGNGIDLEKYINWLFLLTWVVAVLVLNIILMNFIIAEACACYTEISECLEETVQKEKANLCYEAE